MTGDPDVRWRQRSESYQRVLASLEIAVRIDDPNRIEQAGTIQFFEISFELAWKLMRDYLQAQGFDDVRSPRAAIKKAYEVGLITDGHTWLEALKDRNRTTHIYDEAVVDAITAEVRTMYMPVLRKLRETFDALNHA
ncbi:MAG: nucleotidyltransferase substrate binding protein [Catalinimonas sp.]